MLTRTSPPRCKHCKERTDAMGRLLHEDCIEPWLQAENSKKVLQALRKQRLEDKIDRAITRKRREATLTNGQRKAKAQGLVRDVQPEEVKPVTAPKKAAATGKAAAKKAGDEATSSDEATTTDGGSGDATVTAATVAPVAPAPDAAPAPAAVPVASVHDPPTCTPIGSPLTSPEPAPQFQVTR